MKTPLFRLHEKIGPGLALVALLATAPLNAQTPPPSGGQSTQENAPQRLSSDDLNDLLGPIALYPDALVALILPASTVPSDITLAARYLNQNGDNANVDDQPWDPSVKALARYPDVLKWMDDNLEWTNSLGEAFVEQPADVMNAVQVLRAEAKDKGNLVNTPQQTVVVDKPTKEIRIVPTEPDVIYVPQYDPEVVYVRDYQPDYGPVIAFGVGFAAGAWLDYDCDWGGGSIYYGDNYGWNNHNRWNDRGYSDGNVNVVNTNINNTTVNNFAANSPASRWQASPNSRRQFNQRQRENLGNTRIARANAAIRHPNGKNGHPANVSAVRAASVPKPTHLNATRNNNGAKHPNAQVRAPGGANAGKGPNNAPNASGKHPNAASNAGNPNHHARPATAAPSVNGQAGAGKNSGKNHPNKSPNAGTGNSGNGANKPKHNPASAPSNQGGGNNNPKKQTNNSGAPKQHPQANAKPREPKPSAAPQSKPHAQQQQQQHHQQPAQHPQAQQHHQQPASHPQQPRPQAHPQAKPQGHPSGSGQQQGNGGNNKKKKKDNNN